MPGMRGHSSMKISRLRYTRAAAAIEPQFGQRCFVRGAEHFREALPAPATQTTPAWAYPLDPPGVKFTPMSSAIPADQRVPGANDDTPIHLPGAEIALSLNQVHHGADWHPHDHPAMPEIVASGRKPEVMDAVLPHTERPRPPESARLAGLPAAYMTEQMADFKNGQRKSAEPRSVPPTLMVDIAKAVTDDEIKTAVQYFLGSHLQAVDQSGRVGHGPEDPPRRGHTDPSRAGGDGTARKSHHRGAGERGTNRAARFGIRLRGLRADRQYQEGRATGHHRRRQSGRRQDRGGQDNSLRDLPRRGPERAGNVPGIAGASASYTARQLYDFQHGTRTGPDAELMKPVVANLSEEDLVSIVAYVASRTP